MSAPHEVRAGKGDVRPALRFTQQSDRDLEQLLRGFNAAYNDRRQRVLDGRTPNQVTAERLKAQRKLARGKPEGRAGPDDIAKARTIVEDAKEVSQPDKQAIGQDPRDRATDRECDRGHDR